MSELVNKLAPKLTVRNALRLLVWCFVLWVVMISGALLAGFICGLVIHSKPAEPIQVVKYVDHPVLPSASAPPSALANGSSNAPQPE